MSHSNDPTTAPHNEAYMRPILSKRARNIVAEIEKYRSLDAPTHGGKVLSYVYDTGLAELDELAAHAARVVQSINGLDPTAFPSVAIMERDLLGFVRAALNGNDDVYGNVTTGGTESCLLAVKTARDIWRSEDPHRSTARGAIIAPMTVHAAFHKAAQYFDLDLILIPVSPTDGTVDPQHVIDRIDENTALVVLSAPNYPYGAIDPIETVAAVTAARGISLHVDACIGGLALPWWEGTTVQWDFSVEGVTSISADLHKYGYAPKGVSVLLQRGAQRHRTQYFAAVGWPGYPVVNPTLLGSKSAAPIASAWAIVKYLEQEGFTNLVHATQQATEELLEGIKDIEGLAVFGKPDGPLFAIVRDSQAEPAQQVDPHRLADALKESGWMIQSQPGLTQTDGTVLPQSAHLTITPVLGGKTANLLTAMREAADHVRGLPSYLDCPQVSAAVAQINTLLMSTSGTPSSQDVGQILAQLGVDASNGGLPANLSSLLAVAQLLPAAVSQRLLTEILALVVTPNVDAAGD